MQRHGSCPAIRMDRAVSQMVNLQEKTLEDYIDACGKQVLGKDCESFENFPVLIKFIDAKGNLSIQVHPSDDYALGT